MTVPIGVLFVGDSEADSGAVEHALRTGGYLPSVNLVGPADVDIALGRDLVEVAIVDFDLADSEALVRVIGTPARDLPCIVIGTSSAVEVAARAMRAGAHDYILKKDLSYLPLAVEREMREKTERSRRAQAERSLAAGTERLLLETRAQARSLKTLHEVAKDAGGYMDPTQLARITVDGARKLVGADAVGLYWWDEARQRLDRLALASDLPETETTKALGIAVLCFRQGAPVVLDGIRLAAVCPSMAALGFRSAFGVPLVSNERVVGSLIAGSRGDRGVEPDSIELLRLFGAQVGPSLEANRLPAERDLQLCRLEALQRIAVAAGGVLDPAELARMVVDQARDLTDAWSASLVWLQPDDSILVLHDNHPGKLLSHTRLPHAEGATGVALATGDPVLIDDYKNSSAAAEWAVRDGVGSSLAVPLMVRDEALGCLVVRSRSSRHFQEDHVRILSLLAAQVGPSLEGARQVRDREEQAKTFRALHEIAVAASGVLDPGKLSKLAVGHACELLGADGAVVFAWDQQSGLLRPLYETESSSSEPSARSGEGAVGVAFERCEPVVIDDYQQFEKAMKSSAARGMISAAAVPLIVEGRPVGALGVWTYTPRKFNSSEVQVLILLAAQLAPALEASHQAEELQLQAHAFRALHELAVAAGGVLEPATLAQLAIGKACDLLGAQSSVLVRFEKTTGTLEALADNHPELSGETRDRESVGATGLAYRERSPVAIVDYPSWEHAMPTAVTRGVQSVLAVPILVQDVVIGCLAVRWNQRREISAQDAQLLGLLAAEVGPSLEAARIAEEREVRARTFAALHELAVTVGGVLDPSALARLATDHARDLLDADSSTLLWWDAGAGEFRVLAENHPALKGQTGYTQAKVGTAGAAFKRREPVVVADYQTSEHSVEQFRALGIASVLAVPLLVDGRPVGSLVVRTDARRNFTAGDVQLLSLLAAQVAPALHAARLHADLVDSEGRIRAIFRTAPMTIGRIDPNGVMLEMNPVLAEMTGYALDEVVGRHFDDVPWAEGGFIDRPAQIDLLKGRRERVQYEKRLIRKDGSRFWAEITVSTVRRPDREIDFFYVMVKDINERKVAEEALRESEVLKSSIVNSALDCIVAADQEGRILEFNPAAERVFGYSRAQVLGRDVLDLMLSTRYREVHRSNFAKNMQSNEGVPAESRLETIGMRSDGSEFPIEISISIVEQEGGRIFSASIRDLSEREQAATAIRESEAKSRFLASMSHELRTPLNSILGFTQLLDSANTGPLNDRQQRYVGHIESSGRHLLALITDVLDLSKVAAGQMEVNIDDVELVPLVKEAIARVGPIADVRPLEILLDPAPSVWVRADRRRLFQVLLNLLSNAIKFTPAGGLVKVGLATSGPEIEIVVADTGVGIPDDRREWIFEEFTQVQVAPLDSQEGTGLGLALSRRLLTLMDGTIRLQSEVGRGSVFTVTLPRAIRRRERALPDIALPEAPAGSRTAEVPNP